MAPSYNMKATRLICIEHCLYFAGLFCGSNRKLPSVTRDGLNNFVHISSYNADRLTFARLFQVPDLLPHRLGIVQYHTWRSD